MHSRRAFTLIELLVVIAIIAILAVVVILVLNPTQLLKESRDANRLSDAATIKSALGLYSEDVGGSLGSSSVIYVSIPDPLATSSLGDQCQGLGLPSVASDTYQCASSSTYRNINGTGWIPVNLKSISFGNPISNWPVDPINTSSSGEFYTYETNGTLYETTMALEATKDTLTEASDGGAYADLYEQGTNFTLAPVDFYALTGGASPSFSYSYYRAITVTSTTSIASGTNTNFPMLFSGTYSWLEASSSGGRIQNLVTAPNGGTEPADLVFSSSSTCTSPLNFETENYTPSTGAIVDWINVPSLSAGSVIYACYGNSSVRTDQSHPSSTWNSNYAGVWHLSHANGSFIGANTDATANMNVVTSTGSTVGQTNTSPIAGGATFTGANYTNYMSIANSTSLNLSGAYSMEAWFNEASTANYATIIEKGGNITGRDWGFFLNNGSTNSIYYYSLGAISLSTGWSLNTWNHIVVTDSGSVLKVFLNGAQVYNNTNGTGATAGTQDTYIGLSNDDSGYPMSGALSEVRVSSGVLSPSWILTEYNNQSNPSSFYTIGSEF